MKALKYVTVLLFGAALQSFALKAGAEDGWKRYAAPEYGFSMLIPTEAKTSEWEKKPWGGLYATYEGIQVWGLAKLDEQASAEEIEKYGVGITQISTDSWKVIDSGSGSGWQWYKTVKAQSGIHTIYGGYGVGDKGSYLVLVKTTQADYDEHEADYIKWYESIQLD